VEKYALRYRKHSLHQPNLTENMVPDGDIDPQLNFNLIEKANAWDG